MRDGVEHEGTTRGTALVFLAHLALFAVLALPWLRVATHAIPGRTPFTTERDGRLCIWLLAWGAHALATDPLRILDANINHPAPAQYTSAEQLLSFQVVFAPLYALTDDAVLATNLTAFLTYPLAAFLMDRLLVTVGCGRMVAFVIGVLFALGSQRVPANVPVLQYANLYFPLVGLALVRLRRDPGPVGAALLAVVFGLGVFSAYYMAFMLGIAAAVWGVGELVRPGSGRTRYLLLALAAAGVVLLLLGLATLPYLQRPEATTGPGAPPVLPERLRRLIAFTVHPPVWTLVARGLVRQAPRYGLDALRLSLAALGLLGLLGGRMRRLAALGLVITLLGVLLALRWPTLDAFLQASPARFFRYAWRFWVLTGFGVSLLCAAGLETIRAVVGRRLGALVAAGVGVWTLAMYGPRFLDRGFDEVQAASRWAAYDAVAGTTGRLGRGPLLELPWGQGPVQRESDAMVGSTRHWLPLVGGFVGYVPPHRALLERAVAELPAPEALDTIVDMTHARWLLLRPNADWRWLPARNALLHIPRVHVVGTFDGFTLARIEGRPRNPQWFAAIAGGYRPGWSPLGTPLRPLAAKAAIGRLEPSGTPPTSVLAGGRLPLRLRVVNRGHAPWPGAPGAIGAWSLANRNRLPVDVPGQVRVETRWRPIETAPDARVPAAGLWALPHDVAPGRSASLALWVGAPRAPGRYELEARLQQVDGATFEAPGNVPLRLPVTVSPRS